MYVHMLIHLCFIIFFAIKESAAQQIKISNANVIQASTNYNPSISICPFSVNMAVGTVSMTLLENFDRSLACIVHPRDYGFPDCALVNTTMSLSTFCSLSIRFNGFNIVRAKLQGYSSFTTNYTIQIRDSAGSQITWIQNMNINLTSSGWVPYYGFVSAANYKSCLAGQYVTALWGSFYPGPYYSGAISYFIRMRMKCSGSPNLITLTHSSSSDFAIASDSECATGMEGLYFNYLVGAPYGMKAQCENLNTSWRGLNTEPPQQFYLCPKNQVVTGFYWASGEILDGFGPECSSLSIELPLNAEYETKFVDSNPFLLLNGSWIKPKLSLGELDKMQILVTIVELGRELYNLSTASLDGYVTYRNIRLSKVFFLFSNSDIVWENRSWTISLTLISPVRSQVTLEKNFTLHVAKFLNEPSKTIVSDGSGSSNNNNGILDNPQFVIIIVSVTFLIASAAVTVGIYRRKSIKHIQVSVPATSSINSNNISRISSQASNKKSNYIDSLNNTITQTMSSKIATIAIPGYLSMDLNDEISIGKEIGVGGTSKILLATLRNNSRIVKNNGDTMVAVKIPHNTSSADRDSFFYEVAIMSAIPESPNLVKIVGYSEMPVALVMKYYPLQLRDILSSNQITDYRLIIGKIALDIASGMCALHSCGILHLDLKTSNIMVDLKLDGMFDCVICDFGFANFISDDTDKVSFASGMRIPTTNGISIRYAAPELITKIQSQNQRFNAEIDKKIDVYAYSIILFELIARRDAWKGLMPPAIMYKVRSGLRPDLRKSDNEGVIANDESLLNSEARDLCFRENSILTEIMVNTWQQNPEDRLTFKDCKMKLLEDYSSEYNQSMSVTSKSIVSDKDATTSSC